MLPNGVTVVSRQRTGSQVVAIAVAVRAGARYEDGPTLGAARVLESALTLGTARRPSRDELVRSITSRGGRLDVSAGREVMEVNTVVGLSDFELGLETVADILRSSSFDDAAIEAERQVILHELDEREDDAEEVAGDLLFDTVFAAHPLVRRPTGTREGVGAVQVDHVREFWRTRLVGPSTFVAVVSGLRHAEVVALLATAFGQLPPSPDADPNLAPLPSRAGEVVELSAGAEQSYVFVGAPVPGVAEDRAPLRILRSVLGRTSGRLYAEIRDRQGLAYSTSAALAQYADAGIFYVYAGTEAASADRVAELLAGELRRIRDVPVSEGELKDAIGNEVGSQVVSEERSRSEAIALARSAAFGLPEREQEVAALRAVTAADVQRVARRYLEPGRLTVVISRPESSEP